MANEKLTPGNILMIGVPRGLHARIKVEAKQRNVPMHELIEEALDARDLYIAILADIGKARLGRSINDKP